jgi:glyoxylase-like metal-dependent hydrolase (beta-lactamase superfamily II)
VYRDSFPGVEFIQHPNTRADVIARDIPALAKNLETEYPAQVERFRAALRTGKTSRGETVTDSMRPALERGARLYQFFIDDMGPVPIVTGTLLVQDSLTLVRGDRTIVIRYLGRGNTAGDLVVHLPQERILATGDLVVSPTPFSFFSHLGDWSGTLRSLKGLDAGTIMPGHGSIMQDWSYVDRLIPLIESTWEQVKQAVADGADLETTLKTVNLDQFQGNFGRGFEGLFRRPAIEAAFKELKP